MVSAQAGWSLSHILAVGPQRAQIALELLSAAKFNPATVAETKKRFLEGYRKPISSIYSNVLQELLVQMHFIRYNVNYTYDEASRSRGALGFHRVGRPEAGQTRSTCLACNSRVIAFRLRSCWATNTLQVYALGFVSVYDQIMEALPAVEREKIFNAYLAALSEDAGRFRRDATALEQQASALPGPEALTPDASGSELQV